MRPAFLIALPLLGAACVPITEGLRTPVEPAGPPRIAAVEASANQVVIRVSDGSRCIGVRPEGVPGGWTGVTATDCGYAIPFTVEFRQTGSPSRFVIEDPTGVPLGPEGGPGPRAEVFVTDIDGQRKLFISPLGANVRFGPPPVAG